MSKMHIKKGDQVMVLAGNDKFKKGKVIECFPKTGKVRIEGVNIQTKHVKQRRPGDPGGLIKLEGAIPACKVMHICNKCHQPTRIARVRLEDGRLARVCKKCNETFND